MTIDHEAIQQSYNALFTRATELGLDGDLAAKIAYWRGGGWLSYCNFVVAHIPADPRGKVVLDFGCGYGLLAPILLGLGAEYYVGVDVLAGLDGARKLFKGQPVALIEPDSGYIPMTPASADIATMNEVVSHVPKAQLPIVYDEMWRVLAPGGTLFVSDGNGLHSASYIHKVLLPLYNALENGPDGVQVGEPPFPVTVGRCFLNQRADLIRSWHPDLEPGTVEHLAKNTSGLHTDFLRRTVDRFVETGELIRRPCQRGFVPTVPTTGVVEERGFFPEQVALDLRSRGFITQYDTRDVRMPSAWSGMTQPSSFPDGNFCVTALKPG
jgi:SAM-dependent methyltransferase